MSNVSVVLAVYNDEEHIGQTIDSLITQTTPAFEIVIVDDGSTDRTPAILADYAARHPSIRIVTQPNAGLTRALIRGCAEARGELIAREDSADYSDPRRIELQARVFAEHPDVVFAGCATRFIAPDGEELFIIERDAETMQRAYLEAGAGDIAGIGHSSIMFRADAYRRAGGYREQFYFAQDLDLWIRMAAQGRFYMTRDVLHTTSVAVSTISGRYRPQQLALTEISLALRTASEEESRVLLERAAAIRPIRRPMSRRESADAEYFLGAVLRKNRNRAARKYLWRAIRAYPLHLKAWLSLAATLTPRTAASPAASPSAGGSRSESTRSNTYPSCSPSEAAAGPP